MQYEYTCPQGHTTEHFYRSIKDGEKSDQVICLICGETATKIISAPLGFHLYGKPDGYTKPSTTKRDSWKDTSV